MNYPDLLTLRHYYHETPWDYEPERPSWQIDHDRIIFSFAFRRLQDKTQVHPLSSCDFVRTRLTHSLEVSTVARSIGAKVGKGIIERFGGEKFNQQGTIAEVLHLSDFGRIISASALMHDIGNPPFGHSGEDAIRHWAHTSKVAQSILGTFDSEQKRNDFLDWEGNAEGFRIATRTEFRRNNGGMRLTYSTLAAGMKYPTASDKFDCEIKGDSALKKFGFFAHDQPEWEEVAKACGLVKRGCGSWSRHPLAYLTEAADDICYRLIDLQDGVQLGLLKLGEVEEVCCKLLDEQDKRQYMSAPNSDCRMAYLHALCIGNLVKEVAETYSKLESDYLEGKPHGALLKSTSAASILEEMEVLIRNGVYSNSRVLQVETAGFEIIYGLLDVFSEAAELLVKHGVDSKNSNTIRARKIMKLFPSSFYDKDELINEPYERLLAIVDYVAGMTDSFALDLYRKLKGVALPE
jgi:dGTPase